MSAAAWQALLGALDEIDALVAQAAAGEASEPLLGAASGDEQDPGEPGPLAALHDEVRRRLDVLDAELERLLGALVSGQLQQPLFIYLDEHILERLPPALDRAWPLLQRERLPRTNGGEVFFEQLDRLLELPGAPSFLLAFHDFCLQRGYAGRFVGEPERLAEYRRQLAERLSQPPELDEAPPPAATIAQAGVRHRSPLPYYLGAFAFIALLPWVLQYLSNL